MSRNKVILLLVTVIALFFLLPNSGIGGTIKANMINIAPYVLLFIIVWLLVTINMLKSTMTKLNRDICEEHALQMAKRMNITFDVKRFMGADNLIDLYNRVNRSRQVSSHTKSLLYDAMKRKKLHVPLPGMGKQYGSRQHTAGKKKKRRRRAV